MNFYSFRMKCYWLINASGIYQRGSRFPRFFMPTSKLI